MATDSNETQALELWAPQEVCDFLGCYRSQLARLRAADFPEPIAVVSKGRVAIWDAAAVREWKASQQQAV